MAYSMDQFNEELMHYGVLGMKWGVRKKSYDPTSRGGSITKNGKYRASNGIVIGRSRNAGAAIGRRFTTSAAGKALTAFGSLGLNKNQKSRIKKERSALKEYYKVGGDKMLDSYARKTKVSKISTKHVTTGKANKAYKKLWSVKIKDLQKQYGMLEDQMTYGKNADPVKNSRIESQMNSIEEQLRKHRG